MPDIELYDTGIKTISGGKYMREGCTIKLGRYGNDSLAIILFAPDGPREAVASVNMEGCGLPKPPLDHIWLKGWSENAGIPEALEECGFLKRTGRTYPAGYAQAEYAQIDKDVMIAFNEAVEKETIHWKN